MIILIAHYVKAGDSDIRKDLEEWISNPDSKSKSIRYIKLEDLVSPKDVVSEPEDDTFYEDMFELNLKHVDYAFTQDLDEDDIKEIIILFIQGSGRYPYFYILKKDAENSKYKIALRLERYLKPVIFDNAFYFIETIFDFDSGRKIQYNVINFDKHLKFNIFMSFRNHYTYILSEQVGKFISNNIINKIAAFDYSYLGIEEIRNKNEFTIENNEYKLDAKINWTSVGYFSTTIDIKVSNHNGAWKEFEKIWGFTVKKINDVNFICLLEMGGYGRTSAITSFKITVYNMDNWSKVASDYLYPNESLAKING